jgi:phage tail-like protein
VASTFMVNINRFDPYKNYRFLVFFPEGSEPVAGVSKVSGLKRSSDVIDYKAGGDPVTRKGIGRTKYEPITLERGVTHDPAFEAWANAAQKLDKGVATSSLRLLRKTIRIQLLNEAGQAAHEYTIRNCWVSEYQALPDLDAGGNAFAVETIKLEHEGWERQPGVTEPDEKKT